jgi:hypothetical protein
MALSDKDLSMKMCAAEERVGGFDSLYNGAAAYTNATAARRGRC